MLLSAAVAADGRHSDPKSLSRCVAQVYSQSSEDGFIAEIFSRIGSRSRVFLEIGIGDGIQNTTRFLLEQGWTGFWIEGNPEHAQAEAQRFHRQVAAGALRIANVLITKENLRETLDSMGAPAEFDFVSVDIDFNTSHLWRALDRTSRVCCIEYNASIPPSVDLETPYHPQGVWDGTNWFGGSLKALEKIGRSKGMSLVGCDLLGVNAYFVADAEVGDKFRAPFTAETHYENPKYEFKAQAGHVPSWLSRDWGVVLTAPRRLKVSTQGRQARYSPLF